MSQRNIQASFNPAEFRILHLAHMVLLPYRFDSKAKAQQWLDGYQVEESYKLENYRIVED